MNPKAALALFVAGAAMFVLATPFLQEIGEPQIAKVYRARADVKAISAAIEQFQRERGRLPDALSELEGGYLRRIPRDPWGQAYTYTRGSDSGHYDVVSLGADGAIGGRGECSDIRADADLDRIAWQIRFGNCWHVAF